MLNGVIGDDLKSSEQRSHIGFVHQDHSLVPNQRDEFSIWREANTVYMTSGPAGTHPIGLAMAAQARGFDVKVYLNQGAPLFVDGVRNEHKRQTLAIVEQQFVVEAEARQVPVFYSNWLDILDKEANAPHSALMCLISTYRLDRSKAPHSMRTSFTISAFCSGETRQAIRTSADQGAP